MFAARRTDRVIGRIMDLMVSIITMKGASNIGVPRGVVWVSMFDVSKNHPLSIRVAQKGKDKIIVITICLVEAKIKG